MERVAWVPGWYELDPPLEVGAEREFAFWRAIPNHLLGAERLVLYNTLRRPEEALDAHGRITAIHHPALGDVSRVDTRGLDYTITLADGTKLLVNAEEEPGKLFHRAGDRWAESSLVVEDWRFVVEFESLSQLRPG
jgi:hypothetical protein